MTLYQHIIEHLNLAQHPEGGYYRRVYESEATAVFDGKHSQAVCTAIMYLLHGTHFSAFHRIESDELWFLGQHNTSLCVIELTDKGLIETRLCAEQPYHCVKANTWFAARLEEPADDNFALVYCTVAPGFEFSRFEMADVKTLCAEYPLYASEVAALCRAPV